MALAEIGASTIVFALLYFGEHKRNVLEALSTELRKLGSSVAASRWEKAAERAGAEPWRDRKAE